MRQFLRIESFSGLPDLCLEPLGRINLIAGENGVGKSMLLKAIHRQSDLLSVAIDLDWMLPDDEMEAFGRLTDENVAKEIIRSLRIIEPRLRDLSVIAGKIAADLGLPSPLLLSYVGRGFRRLLSILLAINRAKGGNVLIDDVELGLHHSVRIPVWEAIDAAVRQADVQLFATTHSYECIQDASEAIEPTDSDGLHLFRLDRIGNEIRVAHYERQILKYAVEMRHEVR